MITVTDLAIRAGSFSLEHVSFEVPAGQCAVIMGHTGSGKTLLLETICGLSRPVSGTIQLEGRDVTRLKAAERGIGYVPQEGVLFPTMKVRDHLAFSPTIQKWPRRAIQKRVEELAELLRLRHLLHRKPFGLSGGEKQRVALGRALASYPSILCLDEPLSALDDEMREEMFEVLEAIEKHVKVTTLHVTHNREEARKLSDVLLVFKNGALRRAEPNSS